MLFFIESVLPYLAAAVFLLGTCWRIIAWLKTPAPYPLTLPPVARSRAGRVWILGSEILLFDALRRGEKSLWASAWGLHIALFFIITGHFMGIYFLAREFVFVGLSAEASAALSAWLGTVFGVILIVLLIVLFFRRLTIPEVRRLSDPVDYFDLGLIAAIATTGMLLRLAPGESTLADARAYLAGLISLHPTPLHGNVLFAIHFGLVNLLLLYFPFSKLVHLAGIVVNRVLITTPQPVYPTPAGKHRGISFEGQGPRS